MELDLELSLGDDQAQAAPQAAPTVITGQPTGGTYRGGALLTLTVVATGDNLTYQWYEGVSGDTATPVVGETAATFNAGPEWSTSYWCRVSGDGGDADSDAAVVLIGLPTNATGTFLSHVAGDFDLTGSNVDTQRENGGNTDLDNVYVSATKAVRDTTVPLNTNQPTVRTANQDCEYTNLVSGALGILWPDGKGTLYKVLRVVSHPDRFSAPDHVIFAKTSADPQFVVEVVDGPALRVGTNARTELVDFAAANGFAFGTWYVVAIRTEAGTKKLRVRAVWAAGDWSGDADGAVIGDLTGLLRRYYDSGDAGRGDVVEGREHWFAAVHDDALAQHCINCILEAVAELNP